MHKPAAWSRVRRAYGLHLFGDRLTVVRWQKGEAEVVYQGTLDPQSTELKALAKRIQLEAENRETWMAVAGTAPLVFHKWVATPDLPEAKIRDVLPGLLDVELPFAIEQCSVSFPDVVSSTGRRLAVCSRKQDIEQQLSTLEGVGFSPELLDSEALALWDLFDASEGAFLWCDQDRSVLVSGQNGALEQVLVLPGWDRQEALLSRLGRVSFPGKLTVMLEDTLVQQDLVDALQEGFPVVSFVQGGAADVATQVAKRVASGAGCNLLQDELCAPALASALTRRFNGVAMLLGGCGLLLLLLGPAVVWWGNQQRVLLEDEIATVAQSLTGLPQVPRGQELLVVERSLADQEPEGALGLLEFSLWDSLERVLEGIAAQQLQIHALEVFRHGVRIQFPVSPSSVDTTWLQDEGFVVTEEEGQWLVAEKLVHEGGAR